jgi:hypothetical protein
MMRGQIAGFGPKAEILKDGLSRPQQVPTQPIAPEPLAASGSNYRAQPVLDIVSGGVPGGTPQLAADAEVRKTRVVSSSRPTASLRQVRKPTAQAGAAIDPDNAPYAGSPAKVMADRDTGGMQ